tara:strand:+ start:3288 stop:3422 length:135 start_codon:yes stop_codon:yes gene_type:complete
MRLLTKIENLVCVIPPNISVRVLEQDSFLLANMGNYAYRKVLVR